ncbi:hypothetical protein H8E88_24240 [candidate division KSB1 bacterium]|nr:hypothetical protein [candidate division KSB1 bacterium]
MKKLFAILVFSLLVIGLTGMGMAQSTATHDVNINVDDIVLLAVSGGTITLDVTVPAAGGGDPVGETDNTTVYLQYTSVVSSTTRNVAARISASAVPSGLALSVQAIGTPGTNEGTYGAAITLSDTDQNFVTAIASCATGTGGTDGALLEYILSVTSATTLNYGDDTTVTITYTLSDDS